MLFLDFRRAVDEVLFQTSHYSPPRARNPFDLAPIWTYFSVLVPYATYPLLWVMIYFAALYVILCRRFRHIGIPLCLFATTGGTASPAPEKGGEVNVKTYGAVGDGITNDTAALNAALKSLAAAGGGLCLVPNGTYLISAMGVTAPFVPAVSSNVHLVGEGRRVSVVKVNGMPFAAM